MIPSQVIFFQRCRFVIWNLFCQVLSGRIHDERTRRFQTPRQNGNHWMVPALQRP